MKLFEMGQRWVLSKAFQIVIMLLLRSIQQKSTEQVFEEHIGKETFQELN